MNSPSKISPQNPNNHSEPNKRHMPGEEVIWLFILGDMAVFSLFFCMYAMHRFDNLAEFQTAQAALNIHAGAINTLVLLLGSLFVVLALKAARLQQKTRSFWLMNAGTLCGIIFAVVKVIEYKEKAAAGITWSWPTRPRRPWCAT